MTFLFDKKIREITSNTKNINDFTKYIYIKYYDSGLFNDIEMLRSLNEFTGYDFTDFMNRYVYGKEKLPLNDYLLDYDSDGLLNFTEDDLGTNRNAPDSDGDGVSDALETYYYYTNPLDNVSCPDSIKCVSYSNKETHITKEQLHSITIDGYGDDWADIPVLATDPMLDFSGFEYNDADIRHIKTTIQNDTLFLYVDFYAGHSRTIAYDIFFDTDANTGLSPYEYAVRYDIFGNTYFFNIVNKQPENIIFMMPIGIQEVQGTCKDVLEISIPLSLLGYPHTVIAAEASTVDCVQVATVNSPSIETAKLLPYLVGDTAKYFIPLALEPPSNFVVSDVPNDQGHHLKLTWSVSPSESKNCVTWYRIYRSRSNILTDPIPLSRFASLDSLIYYEQHYTIFIDSVAVGTTEYIDKFVPINGVTYSYWLQAVWQHGESQKIAAGNITLVENEPREFKVSAPYPNPFNPYTTIQYQIPTEYYVEIIIYDILGRKISVLQDGNVTAGVHDAIWDGKNDDGTAVGSGVYLYWFKADKYIRQGKMLLMK